MQRNGACFEDVAIELMTDPLIHIHSPYRNSSVQKGKKEPIFLALFYYQNQYKYHFYRFCNLHLCRS